MACNCNNTKYDKTFLSAYQILRMNKPYLSDEPLIRRVNSYRTDIEISYNQSSLNTNGIVLPTILSKIYCYVKIY